MAKTKILNSLNDSLAHSYFSTLNFWDGGYLSDWIVNASFELGINKVEIDILEKKVSPKRLEIRPLLYYLDALPKIIEKTLKSNKLPLDFVIEAKFEITVKDDRVMICDGYVKGKNNRIYRSKPYSEQSYIIFKIFNQTVKDLIAKRYIRLKGRFKTFLWKKYRIGTLKFTTRIKNRMR